MSSSSSFFVRFLRVQGGNVGVVILALVGFAVAAQFRGMPFVVLVAVISLVQGGCMVAAFGPAVGSEGSLSVGGQVVGWLGLIGWFLIHALNAAIIEISSVENAAKALLLELIAYGAINTLALLSFYGGIFRSNESRRETSEESGTKTREAVVNANDDLRTKEQSRRDKARFRCQLYYDQHRAVLHRHFSVEQLHDYFTRYLSDAHSADDVEQRAEQLLELLRNHRSKVDPSLPADTIEGILATFAQRRLRIEATIVDPNDREDLLLKLDQQRDEAIDRAIREGKL